MDADANESLSRWLALWQDEAIHASDMTVFVEDLLVETGEAGWLDRIPPEIMLRVHEDIRAYRTKKTLGYVVSGTGDAVDYSERIARVIEVLQSARRLPDE